MTAANIHTLRRKVARRNQRIRNLRQEIANLKNQMGKIEDERDALLKALGCQPFKREMLGAADGGAS